MHIVGVIQARMGSTRLPGKVMKPLAGRPMIEHILERLRASASVDAVVLATTTDERNAPLADWAERSGVAVVRHVVEDDIAGRMAAVFRVTGADAILKCNGDCPVIDPELLHQMAEGYRLAQDLDYLSNKVTFTYPLGMSAEVIGRQAVLWCDANLADAGERELVCDYIRDNPDRFRVASMTNAEDLSGIGLMVDTPEDFADMADLFARIGTSTGSFGLKAILTAMGHNPVDPSFRISQVSAGA